MNIIFLCGSLEPGRDGVGDYVRRLGGELIRQGHQAAAIALNDRHLQEEFTGEQEIEKTKLEILRLPADWSAKSRFARAKEWVKKKAPEWLSLQFVPFAFDLKGLPFGLSKQLNQLGEGRQWHIMFHELWVGMDKESSRKFVWWGWIQRGLIKSLLKELKPAVIHTQTRLYQSHLKMLGYKAEHLSLFGNIPVVRKTKPAFFGEDLSSTYKNKIWFVLFGGIHPGAPVEQFSKAIAGYARNKEVQVLLTIIGRCGKEQGHWAKTWASFGLPVEVLGEQSPALISQVLGYGSIGISTTPLSLTEKSGAAAAMREHGLPVLSISRQWQPKGFPDLEHPSWVFEYSEGNLEKFLAAKPRQSSENELSQISHQLTDSLLSIY